MAYPDTVFGTDSHTTMVNGLGVVGWGVGGIEAEAAMLGQPSSMLIPPVLGYRLTGRLPEGATATDLVLTITEALRKRGVVGKFVEFYGPGLRHLTIADRVTLGNMCPEYGATVAIFPIDNMTLDYLRLTGRQPEHVALVEAYAKAQGLFRTDDTPDPVYTETLELDLATVEPSLAGPRRPQDRVPLGKAKASFATALPDLKKGVKVAAAAAAPIRQAQGRRVATETALEHGSVVIAAITSCTNTSNPERDDRRGAGREEGGRKRAAAQAVGEDEPRARLEGGHRLSRQGGSAALSRSAWASTLVGYGCTTCIGNSGPLPDEIAAEVRERGLVVASVLSGNRNFEGRIQQDVRANYLASPPLVVAYALAGTMNIDLTKEPLGTSDDGTPVYLKDIWPSEQEIQQTMLHAVTDEAFRRQYAKVFEGDERWRALPVPTGDRFAWEDSSTYIRRPPFLENLTMEPAAADRHHRRARARGAGRQHHDRSHLAGRRDQGRQPGRQVSDRARRRAEGLQLVRRPARQSRSDDARHVRQRAAAQPARAGHRRRIHDVPAGHDGHEHLRRRDAVSEARRAAGRARGQGVRLGLVARLGGEGHDAARRQGGDRGELRAHSPQQSREHGRAAAGVHSGRVGRQPRPDRPRGVRLRSAPARRFAPRCDVVVRATAEDGSIRMFTVTARIDTPEELTAFSHGGILPYVLRQLVRRQ